MSIAAFETTLVAPHMSPGFLPASMSRPQVGIERLPQRMSNEPRESMNCKSCRKRKIKCNRMRPSCEACQVFQCPCIYDAVPKKRGPKTDVLEALLKRVDGLEQKLKEKNTAEADAAADDSDARSDRADGSHDAMGSDGQCSRKRPAIKMDPDAHSPPQSDTSSTAQTDRFLDTYFSRFHGKPFYILDESTLRQRLQVNQVPSYLNYAIYAVSARYTNHPGDYAAALKQSEDYAARARAEIDTDEPSIDAVQALLLLVVAFTAAGRGKKAYMLLTSAVGMAMGLEIHREVEDHARITPVERETRRTLFWTCYLLDRFAACGSKRPSLISDRTIMLRLPSWCPSPGSLPIEGQYFQSASNLQHFQGGGGKCQGSGGMLIDITRILGRTNRYLAAGGVKGDSHFPWHALSNISAIRHELDVWMSGTEEVFVSLDSLFGQTESTVLVLAKLIYHLIHCLIYRPFLPIDLNELSGSSQHQSWQVTATNMCFLHANAIAELVELGTQSPMMEWPSFVGYCIFTAGTVHVHGAHYSRNGLTSEMSLFMSSSDLLTREMQQLGELRYAWADVHHQRETLQDIYNAHTKLVKSLPSPIMRHAPGFHLEDFFDRYSNIGGPGGPTFNFHAANLNLADVVMDFTPDAYKGHGLYVSRMNGSKTTTPEPGPRRPNLKRKKTAPSSLRQGEPPVMQTMMTSVSLPQTPRSLPDPSLPGSTFSNNSYPPRHSPGQLSPPDAYRSYHVHDGAPDNGSGLPTSYPLPPHPAQHNNMSYTPQYNFTSMSEPNHGPPHPDAVDGGHMGGPPPNGAVPPYDQLFGPLPTNTYGQPAGAWQVDDNNNNNSSNNNNNNNNARMHQSVNTHSPQGRSPNGSEGTRPGEDLDPFLSLLEQLSENQNMKASGSEIDYLPGGNGNSNNNNHNHNHNHNHNNNNNNNLPNHAAASNVG